MENLNGALGFKATLDINDFSVSAQAMEKQIRQVSQTAQLETEDMDNTLLQFAQRGAAYISTYLVGQGMMGLLQSIAQVRGQFQQLEIAFETMLGSGTKAQALMSQMVETAAKTPFDLMGVAGGAKQLLAYGAAADKVNDTLVRLGNIASGLSIPLNDIVYLYGTTMVQGRLYTQDVRQFTGRGIPLVRELADMYGVTADKISEMVTAGKIGFPDVEKVINKLTDAGGQFYNLMEKQSKSLTGMISNLEDSWDSMLNEIGKSNQEAFAGAISSASYLVEHYQDILRILKAIAIGYGTVKAAIALNTLATKGYTGVALIDNTVRAAKIALLKADAQLTGKARAQQEAMTAADEAHTAALRAELTQEELLNLQKKLRVTTIAGLLTAQQQEYLSNLGLTTSSQEYEAVAMGVMTVEQQEALRKTDLTAKSAIYKAALEQEVLAKKTSRNATLDAMRAEVSQAAATVEAAKQRAIASQAAVEQARLDVYWAKASGDAVAIATAEKRLEALTEQQSVTRKAALAAQTDFYTKKKALEAAATRKGTVATVADTAATGAQTTAKNLLSIASTKAALAVKTLWAAMKTNPIGWILSIVGVLVSVLTMFRKKTEESTTAEQEFNNDTGKLINQLETYKRVLSSTDAGSKAHKDALEKVNQMAKEYNTTLLTENDTLDQQAKKYDELTEAIQRNVAQKVVAKYTEQAQTEALDRQNDALDKVKKAGGKARYDAGTVTMQSSAGVYTQTIYQNSENIRKANEAIWDMVEAMANQEGAKLKGLTGYAMTQGFEDAYGKIRDAFQRTTNASAKEMEGFDKSLRGYFQEVVNSLTDADAKINQVKATVRAFNEETEQPQTDKVDYLAMSFADLDTLIKNTKKEISEINAKTVRVDTDNTKLQELLDKLKEIQGAVDTKTAGLNTESGISARIKELKDERANVEINGERYKELSREIDKLQAKLSPRSGSRAQAKEALAQRQLEATRAVEEAEIEALEDGYEKRSRILALQHQRNLDRIDKEERELIAARKKAGAGGLTAEEKAGFETRRSTENASYEKDQEKLFDGEIDYKKKQYELYFQWVRNVGQDVADAHFATLLKEGTSFTSWINSKISELEAKKSEHPEAFSAGDANTLNQLMTAQQELTGAKSAMDLFKESVQQTLSEASSLAEKIQAIADLKEKLANGDFHLNEDETTQAAYSLDEQGTDYEKQVRETLLSDFQTYNEKLLAIQSQYQLLMTEAEAEGNAERIELVKRGQADAISALNAELLMGSESWKQLFSDLDSLTVDQIDKLVKEIQKKMDTADLNLNPADLKAVLEQLDAAKKKVLDTNPFKAMGSALKAVFKQSQDGAKKSSKQIKSDWSNLASSTEGCFDFINNAIDSCDVLKDVLGDTGQAVISSISGIAMAGIAMATAIQTAEKGSVILTAISLALQVVQAIFTLVNPDAASEKRIEALEDHVKELEKTYEKLERAMKRTYWVFSPEEQQAYDERKAAIEEQIQALDAEWMASVRNGKATISQYIRLYNEAKKLRAELDAAKQQGDMMMLYKYQLEVLEQQKKDLQEAIKEEKNQKKTDSDKISDWEDQITSIEGKMDDLKNQMQDTLAGTDVESAIDEFGDALWDAITSGEKAMDAFGEKVQEVLKNAVKEALKRQFLAKGINDAIEYLSSAMEDSVLTDEERKRFEDMANKAGEKYKQAIEGLGDWIMGAEGAEDALTGAITGMSEETGGIVAGRLNAVVINQSVTMGLVRQQLEYQARIAAHTEVTAREIQEIKSDVKRIANTENNLLSKGIS